MLISVVVPTCNKKSRLDLTLRSYALQDFPKHDYEIVVIDDGSDEDISSVVDKYSGGMNIRFIKIKKSCLANARNEGNNASEGKILIMSDDDVIANPKFITQHWEAHQKYAGSVVVGDRKKLYITEEDVLDQVEGWKGFEYITGNNPIRENKYVRTINQMFDKDGRSECCIQWIRSITANMSVAKEEAIRAGMFDTCFKGWGVEDVEFGYRLYKNGNKFVLCHYIENFHLEHKRNRDSMVSGAELSFRHFYRKHNDPVIKIYWDFFRGLIGFRDFVESIPKVSLKNEMKYDHVRNEYFTYFKEDLALVEL